MTDGLAVSSVDERALIARLKSGDDEAFEFVVPTDSARLLAVTRRIVGNDEEAKDALQDTFQSSFRRVGRFEGGSLLSTWLHRIAVHGADEAPDSQTQAGAAH